VKENILDIIKWALTAIGGVMGLLLGEINGLLYALIAFVVMDYITGILVAIATKKLNSSAGFRGLAKKAVIFIVVIIANMVDVNILGGGGIARTAAIMFYLANEGISICENASTLGVPLPKKLVGVLEQLKDDAEKENEDTSNADK
jgi:toxin secretion/phage lysis holin